MEGWTIPDGNEGVARIIIFIPNLISTGGSCLSSLVVLYQ